MEYMKVKVLKELGEDIRIIREVDIIKPEPKDFFNNSSVQPVIYGNLKGMGYYLPDQPNDWVVVEDDGSCLVLLHLRRGTL